MRHKNQVFDRYQAWRAEGAQMVLAVVVETLGSTYAKPGDFMLITTEGEFQGLLSGGCVEGDLALHAQRLGRDGGAAIVQYELGGEEDALWGMGAGCEGSLHILLQSFSAPRFAGVFQTTVERYWQGLETRIAVAGSMPVLEWSLQDGDVPQATRFDWNSQTSTVDGYLTVTAAPNVLIAGGGADVLPILDLLDSMGWSVTVAEHRDHYASALSDKTCRVVNAPAETLAHHVALASFDAALIMSHHLETDAIYLRAIAEHAHWSYVGLLGPPQRKDKLLDRVIDARALETVLHGPVGLPLGGREPASIALSIVAHLHAVFARAGRLTGQPDRRVTPLG